jgi:hypothetical protein
MCSSKRDKTENCGNRSINIDVLENFIWQRFFVEKELLNITEAYFKDTDSESKLTQIRADIKLIDKELIENDRMRKKARKLALLSDVDDDEFASEIKELKGNKNDLDIKLKNLLDDENYYLNIDLSKEKEVKDLNEIKESASFNKKRDIIQKYIKEIKVRYYEVSKLYILFFSYNNIDSDRLYFIDRNYNVAYSGDNLRYIIPISEKAKGLNPQELKKFSVSFLFKYFNENFNHDVFQNERGYEIK